MSSSLFRRLSFCKKAKGTGDKFTNQLSPRYVEERVPLSSLSSNCYLGPEVCDVVHENDRVLSIVPCNTNFQQSVHVQGNNFSRSRLFGLKVLGNTNFDLPIKQKLQQCRLSASRPHGHLCSRCLGFAKVKSYKKKAFLRKTSPCGSSGCPTFYRRGRTRCSRTGTRPCTRCSPPGIS